MAALCMEGSFKSFGKGDESGVLYNCAKALNSMRLA